MDINGIKKLLKLLNVSYPQYYKNMTKEDAKDTISLYQMMFADDNELEVAEALKTYIKTNKYPPTIAGIREIVDMNREVVTGTNDFDTYWNEARRAIEGAIDYERLSEPVKRYFRSQRAIDEIGFNEDTNMEVEKSLFYKRIADITKRIDAENKLSDDVKGLISYTVKQLERNKE